MVEMVQWWRALIVILLVGAGESVAAVVVHLEGIGCDSLGPVRHILHARSRWRFAHVHVNASLVQIVALQTRTRKCTAVNTRNLQQYNAVNSGRPGHATVLKVGGGSAAKNEWWTVNDSERTGPQRSSRKKLHPDGRMLQIPGASFCSIDASGRKSLSPNISNRTTASKSARRVRRMDFWLLTYATGASATNKLICRDKQRCESRVNAWAEQQPAPNLAKTKCQDDRCRYFNSTHRQKWPHRENPHTCTTHDKLTENQRECARNTAPET